MDYKDFIKAGNKVIHVFDYNWLEIEFYGCGEVVEISEYPVYYTDGTPDPTPDEYESICQVEVCGAKDDSQIALRDLRPFIAEEKEVMYEGKICKQLGHDEDEEYFVLEIDGEEKVVEDYEVDEVRHIWDLDFDELKELYKGIGVGSIYLCDYKNSFNIDMNEVYNYSEGFLESIYQEYGDDCEKYENAEEFANYCYGIEAA